MTDRDASESRRRSVSIAGYSAVAGVALGALCTIVLTGALVRLTGSGLGCADWPRCSESKFVDVSTGHAAIEQLNRLFTGVVSVSVILAVLAAYRREGRNRVLVGWAWTLILGVLAQVVLGGIVVLTGLNPYANMGHFLLSMVLVTCGFIVWRLSRQEVPKVVWRWSVVGKDVRKWVSIFLVLSAGVMVLGTVVTATGPHAGDENAVRFGFELRSVARAHSGAVILMLASGLWLLRRALGSGDDSLAESMRSFVVVAVAQAGIGYAQYFTDVPVFLVALHIAGATAYWLSVCNVALVRRG